MKIETERLVLRNPEERDANDFVEGLNNIEVTKWLAKVPNPYSNDDAKTWINKHLSNTEENYSFLVELKTESKAIGGIGLHNVDKYQGTAEVGYWLSSKYQRCGYGSEALEAILTFGFNELNLRRIEAGVYKGNPSSGKLLEKYGFQVEGMKIQSKICKATSIVHDEIIYGLLREDFLEVLETPKK